MKKFETFKFPLFLFDFSGESRVQLRINILFGFIQIRADRKCFIIINTFLIHIQDRFESINFKLSEKIEKNEFEKKKSNFHK